MGKLMGGSVRVVRDGRLGGELLVGTVVGDTVLQLDDASDFNEDGGILNSALGEGEGLLYSAADYDANTLTVEAISVPVAVVMEAGFWVAPFSGDREDTVRVAEVDTGDGEPVVATVPYALRPLLPLGDRVPGEEEKVDLEQVGDEILISQVRGRRAAIEWGGGAGNGPSRLALNDYVELAERNTDPTGTPATGAVRVYSKVVAGTSKLFAQDDAGGIHALW